MKISVLSVGRPRGPLEEAIGNFEQRVGHYFSLSTHEVKEVPFRGQPVSQLIDEEGERLLDRLPPQGVVIALDREGKLWSSRDLARYLEEAALQRVSTITFVIGGAYGLAPAIRQRADHRISLSAMTLPHEMARLILTEQLYRAGTIARGEPYHKGSSA